MSMRVRFAPSPTGALHVGGARTALFNWLLARKEGGAFLLRIEDTDRARSSPEMVRTILDGLRWLGLDWDEDPFYQSAGVDRHRSDVAKLLERGLAYRDFTDPAELARLRLDDPGAAHRYPRAQADAMDPGDMEARVRTGHSHAVRFRVPEGVTEWQDLVHGTLRFRNEDLEDLVLLRMDGTPTYNLAVASDDAHMNISHVIRGDDHISNTPKQILLHRSLNRPVPEFAHLPMILGADGKRLSKRHGATAVGSYADAGILPVAMVNFLALLGWSPGTDEEVLTMEELMSKFSLDRVIRKSAVFNPEKLDWLNGRHLSLTTSKSLIPLLVGALDGDARREAERLRTEDRDRLVGLIDLLKPRARNVRDLARQSQTYLLDSVSYDLEAVRKHWDKDGAATVRHLVALSDRLAGVAWDEPSLEAALRGLADELGVGAGKLIHPLRVAVTGEGVSPGIFEVLTYMGRDRSIARIAAALGWLEDRSAEGA